MAGSLVWWAKGGGLRPVCETTNMQAGRNVHIFAEGLIGIYH